MQYYTKLGNLFFNIHGRLSYKYVATDALAGIFGPHLSLMSSSRFDVCEGHYSKLTGRQLKAVSVFLWKNAKKIMFVFWRFHVHKKSNQLCSVEIWRKKFLSRVLKNTQVNFNCREWPDWAIYWTLGKFLKPLATINLPKSHIFLGNFC